MTVSTCSGSGRPRRESVRQTLRDSWRSRRVWWFTATARTRARFARTTLGSFWLGLSNLFSIAVLAAVYGTVFKVQNFTVYVVYLGLGLVVWNTISAAVSGHPICLSTTASPPQHQSASDFLHPGRVGIPVADVRAIVPMVLLALGFFQHNLLLNLVVWGWLPLFNLFLLVLVPGAHLSSGGTVRDLYQLVPIVLRLISALADSVREKNLGPWPGRPTSILSTGFSPIRHTLMAGEVQWGMGWCCWPPMPWGSGWRSGCSIATATFPS